MGEETEELHRGRMKGGGGGGDDGEKRRISIEGGDGKSVLVETEEQTDREEKSHKQAENSHSKGQIANESRLFSGRTSALAEEIEQLSKEKKELVMKGKEPQTWKQSIQDQIEKELERRVRDALETPPLERMRRNRHKARLREQQLQKRKEENKRSLSLQECDSHAQALPSLKERFPWNDLNSSYTSYSLDNPAECRSWFDRELFEKHFLDYKENGSDSSGFLDMNANHPIYRSQEAEDISKTGRGRLSRSVSTDGRMTRSRLGDYSNDETELNSEEEREITEIRKKTFHRFTSVGFKEAIRKGRMRLKKIGEGKYIDANGVILTTDGPFWPPECGPLYPKPDHSRRVPSSAEPLYEDVPQDGRTIQTQRTKWYRPWEGTQNVFDSERTSKGTIPHTVPEGCCPSLVFESRFESGNLRQARRIGQFEYDLVLKTDLYTSRHTQWYYFRIQKMLPGITYKFNIINLLKKDSLYNHGMRPLMYSEKEAEASGLGWVRAGHHISYTRSYGFNRNSLLHPELTYYVLEWQMEFAHEDDTCYMAHCYPFTFTDLCQHLDDLLGQPDRRKIMRRDILCETRAGNSCFVLTVTNFTSHQAKKGVVITARVHPGETNASWMMKGFLDFITSADSVAKELRMNYIFKIIPMLNPDGVIVGNYRCSLAGRDLNRNYRHPKKTSFPTVWGTKQMLADFSEECEEILVYCDMHGHSRKHNVFIYGCDPENQEVDMAAFLCQRLFPWLLSQKAPDKFSFRGCKFRVKRCKESTGRVVMWRQMGISNSFTLEATFCGSKNITSDAPRHFNLQDFQDLGRHFCEALLVYHQAQENSSMHSELILELTKEITHHILLSRGLLPPNMTLLGGNGHPDQNGLNSKKQGGSKKNSPSNQHGEDAEWAGLDKRTKSKLAALKMIDTLSSETIQGCIDLLKDLHIHREFAESDTSDSDSASESEIPNDHDDEKTKKKRKKKGRRSKNDHGQENDDRNKKKSFDVRQRDEDILLRRLLARKPKTPYHRERKGVKSAGPEPSNKTDGTRDQFAQKLRRRRKWQNPTQVPTWVQDTIAQQEEGEGGQDCTPLRPSARTRLKPLRVGKCSQGPKKHPPFVNRYANRTNHGIPMFAQERIEERAKLRMAAAESGNQDTANEREDEIMDQVSHDLEYARLIALSRSMQRQNDEVRYKLINPNSEGALPKGLSDMKIRHPYSHGNNSFALNLDRLDSEEKSTRSAPPRTPPRKLDPMTGATSRGAADKRAAFAHYGAGLQGNKVSGYALDSLPGNRTLDGGLGIPEGLLRRLSGGGEMDKGGQNGGLSGTDDSVKGNRTRTSADNGLREDVIRTNGFGDGMPPCPHPRQSHPGGDGGGMIMFGGSNTKPTSNSFSSTASAWTNSSKSRKNMKDPSQLTANSLPDNRLSDNRSRQARNTLGRESTMDLIQKQYGRFLTGVNLGSKSSTAKYLDGIARSVSSGSSVKEKDKSVAGVTRSAGAVAEKRTTLKQQASDRTAILKLADNQKKKSSHPS